MLSFDAIKNKRKRFYLMQDIAASMKLAGKVVAVAMLAGFAVQTAFAQKIEFAKEKKAVVKHLDLQSRVFESDRLDRPEPH